MAEVVFLAENGMDSAQFSVPYRIQAGADAGRGFGMSLQTPGMAIYRLRTFNLDFRMVGFLCWVAVVSLATAFSLALLQKWGWVEWMQVHAPTDFFYRLFSCKFCLSWWVSVFISLSLCVVLWDWTLVAVPICSTVIACRLW